jgi:hypothetical protein
MQTSSEDCQSTTTAIVTHLTIGTHLHGIGQAIAHLPSTAGLHGMPEGLLVKIVKGLTGQGTLADVGAPEGVKSLAFQKDQVDLAKAAAHPIVLQAMVTWLRHHLVFSHTVHHSKEDLTAVPRTT